MWNHRPSAVPLLVTRTYPAATFARDHAAFAIRQMRTVKQLPNTYLVQKSAVDYMVPATIDVKNHVTTAKIVVSVHLHVR
jgi:hypothetical protein